MTTNFSDGVYFLHAFHLKFIINANVVYVPVETTFSMLNNMVFSAEDRIVIKVWPTNISPNLNLVDYRISGETATACLPQLDS